MSDTQRVLPWKKNAHNKHKKIKAKEKEKEKEKQDSGLITIIISKKKLGPKILNEKGLATKKTILHHTAETVTFLQSLKESTDQS